MTRRPVRPARTTTRASGNRTARVFEQHQATAVDSLLRLLADPLGSVLTWAVMGIALALPLTLYLLLQNLSGLGTQLDDISTLSVYLDPQLPPAEQQQLAYQVQNREDVRAVTLVSAEDALAEFTASSGLQAVLEGLDANPLPPVLIVTPATREGAALSSLRSALTLLPGVDDVAADLAWLQRLADLIALATRLAVLLGGLLALGIILVIGNTIRLAIENRRAEIVVVKLVGGTDAYVARPFLYTGLWYGIGGGVIAVLLAVIGVWLLSGPYTRLLGSYGAVPGLQGLGITGTFLVLAGAGALGWGGAVISVLRHLRSIEPR